MKVLLWDLECSPHQVYTWGLFNQNISLSQVEKPGEVISFAAKWYQKSKVTFRSTFHDGKEAMLQSAWELLDEADALVSWNGKSFDTKTMNKEFILAGMTPPSPAAEIDLMLAVKKRARMLSNKLQFVSTAMGLEGKVQHEGFDLWRAVMDGDERAWARMKRYNIQDVRLLEDLYAKLLPWLPSHPNVTLFDEAAGCPKCGSSNIQKRGFAYTQVSKFQQWACMACGGWFRSGKREAGADLRSVA